MSQIMDRIFTVTSRIAEMELPVVDEERMAAFYTLDICEATSTIKCLHDDCIEVFNYKDTLTEHQTNTKFALRPATFIPMANSVRLQQQQCGK